MAMRRMPPNGPAHSFSGAASTSSRSSAKTPSTLAGSSTRQLAHGTDALVVAGGDGVISLALQALARSDIPLGIVPAGTGNDHAREYGLPTEDPEAAADVVCDGWAETVDLGRIRTSDGAEKWFGTVMAAGFDSLVSDRANRMRWPHGRMRYNLAMLAELSQLRPLPFRLVLDDEKEIVADLTLAAFGNTKSYGGGMLICPNADHADGQLDITIVRSGSRTRLVRLFPTVFKGTHVELGRGDDGPREDGQGRKPGHQRLRRRRVRVRASRRGVGGQRRVENPAIGRRHPTPRLSQLTSAPWPPSR